MKTILTLSNINVNNFRAMHDIVGEAGYSGSLKIVDEETYTLDLGDVESRSRAMITEQEVKIMIGELIMYTSIKVTSLTTK